MVLKSTILLVILSVFCGLYSLVSLCLYSHGLLGHFLLDLFIMSLSASPYIIFVIVITKWLLDITTYLCKLQQSSGNILPPEWNLEPSFASSPSPHLNTIVLSIPCYNFYFHPQNLCNAGEKGYSIVLLIFPLFIVSFFFLMFLLLSFSFVFEEYFFFASLSGQVW